MLDRVLAGGFDPLYGARPLKRFLEQNVASLLADHIAGAPAAAMRELRLYVEEGSAGAMRLHAEALTEAESSVQDLPLEPLMSAPIGELRARLPAQLDYLDELLQGEQLSRVAERIRFHLSQLNLGKDGHAEDMHNLEEARLSLTRLRGRIGHLNGKAGARRRELLSALAEVTFLRRALACAEEPGEHAVLVELAPLGWEPGGGPRTEEPGEGLLGPLVRAYLGQRCELERYAVARPGGIDEGDDPEELGLLLRPEPTMVVLELVGLGVADLLSGETGCHMWSSLAGGSRVLRVRVLPAPRTDGPAAHVRVHAAAAARFTEALERGEDPLPQNPDRLLPLVREYRFDPPGGAGSAPLELTDHGLGYAAALHARSLEEGLGILWLLRMSRQEEEA